MKTKEEIEKQLEQAYNYLNTIDQSKSSLWGSWRRQKGYIDALEWVLDQDSGARSP